MRHAELWSPRPDNPAPTLAGGTDITPFSGVSSRLSLDQSVSIRFARAMELVAITPHGRPEKEVGSLPTAISKALAQTRSLYERVGYAKPWVSYVGVEAGRALGLGAFKSAPEAGRVEIAYMTAPEHEGRGHATSVARELIALAKLAEPGINIRVQTLSENNASVSILKRLGFEFAGDVQHSEDGLVWEWSLRP